MQPRKMYGHLGPSFWTLLNRMIIYRWQAAKRSQNCKEWSWGVYTTANSRLPEEDKISRVSIYSLFGIYSSSSWCYTSFTTSTLCQTSSFICERCGGSFRPSINRSARLNRRASHMTNRMDHHTTSIRISFNPIIKTKIEHYA